MKDLQEKDLIYLAGFIDADGSIFAQLISNNDYKFNYQIRVTVQITQLTKRKLFLTHIRDLIGVGTIRDRKNVSDYVLVEPRFVYKLLTQLQPFLRLKKKQANLVLKIIEQLPSSKDSQPEFLKLCKQVDQIAALNDSKKRKHTTSSVVMSLGHELPEKVSKEVNVPVETSDLIEIEEDPSSI
uniref:Homing endonuclease LAGLIDADG domain-containing protein n=1 Tax=Carteria oliveri TaxID=52037 RepID=Q8SML7_9CHLO|nr:unknown [Carteria olivieri]